jgi:uncharacterized protein (TIGR02266 family)
MAESRRGPRIPVFIDIEYAGDSPPIRRRTRNLGAGGVFIETRTPLPEGLPVSLQFALPGQTTPMRIEAAVAWSEPEIGMGLRFTGIDPAGRAAIRAFVVAHAGGKGAGQPEEPAHEPPAVLSGTNGRGPAEGPDPLRLPAPVPDAGTLYLTLVVDDHRNRLKRLLAAAGVEHREPYRDLLAIPLTQGLLPRLVTGLREAFTTAELARSRVLVLTEGVGPNLADLMHMQPLSALVARIEHGWLLTMLRDDRLVSYFQPIVHADAPQAIFGYEALLRGRERDGLLVGPRQLYATARYTDLLVELDRLARLAAIRGAVEHRVEGRLFINVNPASVDDPREHLQATMEAIDEARIAPSRVVIEVVESDEITDPQGLKSLLDLYRQAGFGVALDDLGAGYSSLNSLTLLRPDFVKLDMALVRDVDVDAYRAEIVGKLLESARNLGIRTVAEGVESEGEWKWLRAHGVDFMQGYLFAHPGLPPPASCLMATADGRLAESRPPSPGPL